MDIKHTDSSADRLLQHASWIRSLARSLIPDEATAENLVQDTWLAALKHRPSSDRSLRPWLARVLRNFALKSFRRRDGRELPEDLATEMSGPEELCEHLESEQILTEELRRLDEPFRSTLLLRFYRGLEPIEIARRQGTPAGTVRWRIKRGLALLRVRLDDRYCGKRREWCLALLPLARWKGLAATGAGGTSITLPWILAMKTSLKICGGGAVALVATAALSVLGVIHVPVSWFGPSEPPVDVAFRPIDRSDADAGADPNTLALNLDTQEPERVKLPAVAAVTVPEDKPAPTLTGVVEATIVDDSGSPLAGAQLREVDRNGQRIAATGDGLGRVRLVLEVGEKGRAIHIESYRNGYASRSENIQLGPGQTIRLGTVMLTPGGAIAGRVVDRTGQPVAHALVTIGPIELDLDMESAQVQRAWQVGSNTMSIQREITLVDGSFRLSGLDEGFVRVWAEADGRMPTCTPPVAVHEGKESYGVEIMLPVIGDENRVAGIVRDPEGESVPFASLEHITQAPNSSTHDYSRADGDGRFEFILTSLSHLTITARDPDDRYGPAHAQAVPAGEQGLVLQLVTARQMGLRVFSRTGEPVERFGFDVLAANAGDGEVVLQTGDGGAGGDTKASFRVPDKEYLVRISAPLYEIAEAGPFHPRATIESVEVPLTPIPGLKGAVVALDEPVPGARVKLYQKIRNARIIKNGFPCLFDPHVLEETITDESGFFALTVRESGEYFVRADMEGYAPAETGPFSVAAHLQTTPVVLHLGAGGTIQGRVITPDGSDPTGMVVGINHGDGEPQTQRVGPDGEFHFSSLVPGPWRVEKRGEDLWEHEILIEQGHDVTEPEIDFNCQVYESETTYFDLRLVDEHAYRLRGTLTLDGRMPAGWISYLCLPDSEDFFNPLERWDTAMLDPGGNFELSVGDPGLYKLCIKCSSAEGAWIFTDEVELQNETTAWREELVTGSLEIDGVAPQLVDPPFVYYWEGRDGLAFMAMSRPDESGVSRLGHVPVGTARLVKMDLERGMTPRLWDALMEMEIRVGEVTRIGAP